ncbi:alpha/beta hydrolase fold domain-containing protein [Streptomyces sp. NPDC002795]|uniref:alpha/beta hydrolase fold domain-containing protein n=1 Tax=Streptomyces sp. NPDC002795 TaxID=3364665 RepID=UPI00368D588E
MTRGPGLDAGTPCASRVEGARREAGGRISPVSMCIRARHRVPAAELRGAPRASVIVGPTVDGPAASAGLDLAVVRDIVDSYQRASTEPEGVSCAEVDAGGVPAPRAIPEGGAPDQALLHFHFGGSVTASMYSDRKAAGRIAKAAGVRSLVVDFRLAPEHPCCAQLDDAGTAYRWLFPRTANRRASAAPATPSAAPLR